MSIGRLALGSARRPWLVVIAWLVAMALALTVQVILPSNLTGQAEFTSEPESVRGLRLIEERLHGVEPARETIVVTSPTLTVDAPAFQQVVNQTTQDLRGMTDVVASAVSYFEATGAGSPQAAAMVAEDRHSTIIPVTLTGEVKSVEEHGGAFLDLIRRQGQGDVQVLTVGDLSASHYYSELAQQDLEQAEIFGLPVALVILVLVFGALVAAAVPLIVALAAIAVAIGLTAVVGQAMQLTSLILNVITMIGLAVGIDYSLFIIERFREERARGFSRLEAIERTGATATKAVVFSGTTVIIALMGMFLMPVTVFRSVGVGAVIVVAVSIAASVTLVPALLSLLGDRINWPRRRTYDRPAADNPALHHGFWARVSHLVMARPIVSMLLASGLLIAMAVPFLDLRTGTVGVENYPPGMIKSAYQILARDFYAGIVSPIEVVIDAPASDPRVQSGIEQLSSELAQRPVFGPVQAETNDAGDLTLLTSPLAVDSTAPEAADTVHLLRDDLIPMAFGDLAGQVHVSGMPAFNEDFNQAVSDRTPIVFAFVLGLSFVLLTLAFRSIVVPIKAIIMNLLSVGASYGILVLVFQKGYGADLFGFTQTNVITNWLPIFLFCILFGLSMDYHVFLLSRIREHYDQTGDNRESVAVGLESTGRIITGAALIMVAVFFAFSLGDLVELQQLGFGLAVAIFLDATIVRTILVPSTMALLGKWNWYLPRWLHWLPDLRVEGDLAAAPSAAVPAEPSHAGGADR
ncbi:MAG TPA: MMPL family transporter [Thermomicrobiales bacterium]|nr:MMPL family transporter [Thermomicrobiales bacterium]